jgi:DNA-binding transcriptional regulator YiaG
MRTSKMKATLLKQKEPTIENVQIVEKYDAVLLGAPFKIFLYDSVRQIIDSETGKVSSTVIPNLSGLRKTVALTRCMNPRKLNGSEIKFIRKAIGCKAVDLAAQLDLSAEHLSRCEADDRILSGAAEKLLRVIVLKRVHMLVDVLEELIDLVEKSGKQFDRIEKLKDSFVEYRDCVADLESLVLDMTIESAFDANDPLEFSFRLKDLGSSTPEASNDDDAKWRQDKAA